MHRHRFYLTLFLYVSVLLGGCAGRTAPAPVILLNSQVSDGSEEYTKKTYKVQRGDTLYAVAWYTGNDYRDLAKYNQLLRIEEELDRISLYAGASIFKKLKT